MDGGWEMPYCKASMINESALYYELYVCSSEGTGKGECVWL